jgi:hypothetical protein
MEYVHIDADGSGGSKTTDVRVELHEAAVAAGVPPLLVSSPIGSNEVFIVEFPPDVIDTAPHPAPRRQFGVVLSGAAETETTDGQLRRSGPGALVLLTDTAGTGHTTRVVEQPFRIMFMALADTANAKP